MQPLEDTIRCQLIPAWTGKAPPSDLERDLFALPTRLGGLGIVNPVTLSSKEFPASVSISAPLCDLIESQQTGYPRRTIAAQLNAKKDVRKQRQEHVKSSAANVKSALSASLKYAVDLAQEKGASTWLTALPLDEFGFSLHKGAFKDALALRYGWLPSNVPTSCVCGSHFTVEHSLSCPKGGFPSIRQSDTMRSATLLVAGYLKCAVMFASNPLYNQSLARLSLVAVGLLQTFATRGWLHF